MFCPKCNMSLPEESQFCSNCGTNLKQIQEQLQNQQATVLPKQPTIQLDDDNNRNKKSNKTKRNIIIIGFLIVLIVGVVFVIKNTIGKSNKYSNYGSTSSSETITIVRNEIGTAKFIDGTFTDIKVNSESDAYKALDTLKNELKFNDVNKEFTIESIETSEDITYYKFHQYYKDVEVYGMNLVISADKKGKVLSMSGYYIPNIEIDVNSKKTKEEIEDIVKQDLGDNTQIVKSNKYIYADNKYADLVYVIDAYSNKAVMEYIIDANTGEIINSTDIVEYVAYDFNGQGVNSIVNVTIEEFYDISSFKTRYRLVDPNRNIAIVDGRDFGMDLGGIILSGLSSNFVRMVGDLDGNNFVYLDGLGENKEIAEIGISALKTFSEIYDYYDTVLGRKSYDNKGSKIVLNIGMKDKTFGSEQLENAAWLCLTNQMYIGYWKGVSFATVKDVLTHEFTHGVISKTANFAGTAKRENKEKAFETGSLNEGISDILGSLIEGKNWTINEDIEILRSLSDPNAYEYPSEKGGQYYYPDGYLSEDRTLEQFLADNNLSSVSSYDGGGKHKNATVPGHAAYLMYTNGAFNSMEEMAKVWYNSLFLMSSYSNFEDCALAVIQSAKNLGLSDNSIRIIEEAFMETKMLEDTRIEITGTVSSGEVKLSDVTIELKAENSQNHNYILTTDVNGKFTKEINSGTYEVTFTKEDFEEYKTTITVHGDTTLNVELASILKQEQEDETNNKNHLIKCSSRNCHILTIYFLDNIDSSGLKENYETYPIDDGTILAPDSLINMVNNTFGGDIVQTDGETFKVTISGFTVDFAWYYKDTDIKFDWSKPITEDTEIEMKMINGLIDNDFIKGIYDIFSQ